MRILLFFAFLFVGETAFSQDSITYFDKNWQPLSSANTAVYYRQVEKASPGFIVRDYFLINNQLQMQAECSVVSPELIFQGYCQRFYQNGNKESSGNYLGNQREGLWLSYYESGKPRVEIFYTPKLKASLAKYHQHWDEAGNPELEEGTGIYKSGVNEEGIIFWNDVQDSTLLGVFYIHQKDTIFAMAERTAEYQGGSTVLNSKISSEVNYPKQARRMGVEGRVFVSFTVGKDGKPRDAAILKGIGAGCDEEALRAVMLQQDWQAAIHRGKTVCQKLILPVVYKLND